jgi:hypothetical protein
MPQAFLIGFSPAGYPGDVRSLSALKLRVTKKLFTFFLVFLHCPNHPPNKTHHHSHHNCDSRPHINFPLFK